MVMAAWRATIVDELGNIVPNCAVEVRHQETIGQPLATIKPNRDGSGTLSNPFNADADGFAALFAQQGCYRIRAYKDGFERIWEYVGIGTAQEWDGYVREDYFRVMDTDSSIVLGENDRAVLNLINTEGTTQRTGFEIHFGQEVGLPFAVIKSEISTGPSPYKGDLVFATRDLIDGDIQERLRLTGNGTLHSGDFDSVIGGRASYSAVNKYGYQNYYGFSRTSDIESPDLVYQASTIPFYGIARNDTAVDGNINAWGGYFEAQAWTGNELTSWGVELDVANLSGLSPRRIDPNDPFGLVSGVGPHTVVLASQPQGVEALTTGNASAWAVVLYNSANGGPKFEKGLMFAKDSILSVNSRMEALSLSQDQGIAWYDSASSANVGYLFADETTLSWRGSTGTLDASFAKTVVKLLYDDLQIDQAGGYISFKVGPSATAFMVVGRTTVDGTTYHRNGAHDFSSAGGATPFAVINTNGVGVPTAKGFLVNSIKVLGDRRTGWTAATGTATRTTFATGSVTLPQLAERVKALIDDFITHGAIGT